MAGSYDRLYWENIQNETISQYQYLLSLIDQNYWVQFLGLQMAVWEKGRQNVIDARNVKKFSFCISVTPSMMLHL